jgi:hypothetical protein
MSPRGNLVALALGALALVAGTAAGWSAQLGTLLLTPPPAVRLGLAALSLVLGFVLLVRSAERLGHSSETADMVRAVRIVFLSVAAFAAAGGWLVGSPVPIVAALVIAGVDVLETTFLLLVAGARDRGRV